MRQKEKESSEARQQLKEVEMKLHQLQNRNEVFVDSVNDEVDIKTANLTQGRAVSQKQLYELQQTVISVREENERLKSEWHLKEASLKALANKARDEKTQVEKMQYDTEFLVKEKEAEVKKLRSDFEKERNYLQENIDELKDKVKRQVQNQKSLND